MTPQAQAWEDLALERVVARYALILSVCETTEATAALLGEARQMEDRLGLSPMALKRLQWEVEGAAPVKRETDAEVTKLDDYRDL